MIIVRAPLRISLGGGGTDLPSWYEREEGFFVSASINKYIYMTGSERLMDKKLWLSYSKTEVCDEVGEVQHGFLRACLERYKFATGIEIHSISELPGNSGLGSSGAFLVGCLTLLNVMGKVEMSRLDLAERACEIEMIDLKRSSGKQDPYSSAIGGINRFTIDRKGAVEVSPLVLPPSTVREIEDVLFIYYSGISRNSDGILAEQSASLREASADPVSAMRKIQAIGRESAEALAANDLDAFGRLLHEHWLTKKTISTSMSDSALDRTYEYARSIGATGGKLIGAGGGGYWMFHVSPERQREFRAKIETTGLAELTWRFDFHGCSVIHSD